MLKIEQTNNRLSHSACHLPNKPSSKKKKNDAKHSPDGGPPSPTVSSHSTQTTVHPTAAPRWPLKPGVLVHINRSHSLRSGLSVRASNESPLRNELMGGRNEPTMADRFIVETTIAKVGGGGGKMFRRRKEAPQRRLTVSGLHDEGMLARANKIKAMFGVQLKEQATLPGISREKTGELCEGAAARPRCLSLSFIEGRDDRFNVGRHAWDDFSTRLFSRVFLRGNQLDENSQGIFIRPLCSAGARG